MEDNPYIRPHQSAPERASVRSSWKERAEAGSFAVLVFFVCFDYMTMIPGVLSSVHRPFLMFLRQLGEHPIGAGLIVAAIVTPGLTIAVKAGLWYLRAREKQRRKGWTVCILGGLALFAMAVLLQMVLS
jgi:hypothetical protein